MKREKTKFIGVYKRNSDHREYKNKPDICFDITYKYERKMIREKIGWASEGYTALMASIIRGERIRDIRHGKDLPQDKKRIPLFQDAARKYLEWTECNKTRNGYDEKNRYNNHLKIFDHKRLNEISSFHLEKLKKKLLDDKGLAPQTAKHVLVIVREIFNKANKFWNIDIKNPIKGIKLPNTQSNFRLRFYTREEAELLLDALKSYPQLYVMVLLSLRTGLRLKEITGIMGHDIDFKNSIVSVLGKNKEIGHVYLTPDIQEILSKYNTPGHEYVFKSKSGGRVSNISKTFPRIIKKLGFNKEITDRRQILTFHSLRHTFASWLALNGEQLKTIQELMRHKTIQMTMKYAHLIPDHKRRAVEELLNER